MNSISRLNLISAIENVPPPRKLNVMALPDDVVEKATMLINVVAAALVTHVVGKYKGTEVVVDVSDMYHQKMDGVWVVVQSVFEKKGYDVRFNRSGVNRDICNVHIQIPNSFEDSRL